MLWTLSDAAFRKEPSTDFLKLSPLLTSWARLATSSVSFKNPTLMRWLRTRPFFCIQIHLEPKMILLHQVMVSRSATICWTSQLCQGWTTYRLQITRRHKWCPRWATGMPMKKCQTNLTWDGLRVWLSRSLNFSQALQLTLTKSKRRIESFRMAKCRLTRKKTRVTNISPTPVTKECARKQLDCTKGEQRAKRFFWWTRVCRRKERLVATKTKATNPTKSRSWASRVTIRSTAGPSKTMVVAQRLTNVAKTDKKSFLIQHRSMQVIPQTKMIKVSWTTDKFSNNDSTPALCTRNWT